MMPAKLSYASALALLLVAPAAFGQISTSPSPSLTPSDRQTEQQADPARALAQARVQAALSLLDEVVNETQSLKLPHNRIRLQLIAADLLWPRDKARARELFSAAMNSLTAVMSSIASDDPQYYNRISAPAQLRQQMLQVVAQRDPKLALDFLRATRQPPPPVQPGANYREADPELTLELNLAEQIAANDPEQALRLARETLTKGFANNLVGVLEQVRQKDRAAADALAIEIIRKLRTTELANDREAANVAAYLLQTTRPAAPQPDNQKIVNLPDPRQLRVDEQARRDLIGMTTKAVLSVTPAQRQSGSLYSVVSALQQSLPEVERYAPTQAVVLRRRLAEQEQAYNPQAAVWRQYEPLMREGTADALTTAAATAPAEIRDQLYRAAAERTFNEGGLERARAFLETRVENVALRRQLARDLEQRTIWQFAQRGEVEQVLHLVERLPTMNERVNFMLHIARTLSDKGQPEAARRLIDQAANETSGRAKDTNQFSAQLQVAQAYVPLAPANAFEIVEARLDQLNELIAAAAVLDGFGQEQFEEDELRLQSSSWHWLLEQCGSALAALARTDFERARAAADRLQRPETRLFVRLMIAQRVLIEQTPGGGTRGGTIIVRGRGW